MSTKTSFKRIALVAVAALGMGVLTSVSPANAAAAVTNLNLLTAGSTTAVTQGASNTADTAYVRSGASSQTFVVEAAAALVDADDFDLVLATTGTLASVASGTTVNLTGAAVIASGETGTATTITLAQGLGAASADRRKAVVALPAGNTAVDKVSITTGTLAAGTYYLWMDPSTGDAVTTDGLLIATITSYDVGAPVTASYSAVGYTQVGSPANVNATLSLKDASNRSTFLVGAETVTHASTKEIPASDQTLAAISATTSGSTPAYTSGVFAGYTVALPGGAGGNVPTVGSKYTITSTIVDGSNAASGSATVTYKNVATTAGIAGGSITFTGATSKAVVSTISTVTSLATTAADYVITVKDAAGALVKGVTPVATATSGTVTTPVGTTVDAGTDSSFVFTPAATAGTSTVTFALATGGSSSLSTSVAITATGYGATVATTASVTSVKNTDGSGVVMTSTAPATNAWSAARNVTGLTVTVGGLDAAKVAKFTVGGTATGETINTVATGGSIYPVASAAGVVSFNLALTSATDGQTVTVAIDADGTGGADATLTITFSDTAATLVTVPASASLNMSTPSQTKPVTATLTDQYGNAITGGSFTLTNTVVPAGATAATAVNVNADAAGKATLNAVLGSTLGTYTFSLQAYSANAATAGSASTISWSVTATGIAGTLTLTDNDAVTATELTSDNKGSRTIVVPSANVVVAGGLTDSAVALTVTSATPAGLGFKATATNGIRLFTTTPHAATITPGKSEVTGTAGSSANLWAVPTKVGAGTITVVAGGLTTVYTLTGAAAAAGTIKAAFVTVTATSTPGQYTVKATDGFGNGLVSDVAISLTGPGAFSNGFKNLTVTTGADGTNTFNVVSDGSAATTIKAVLAAGTYAAIAAANAKLAGIVGLGTDGATTDTATASLAGKGGTSEMMSLTLLINSLIKKLNALATLVAKIQKKLGVK